MIEIKNKRYYKGPGHYVGRPMPLGNPYTHMASDVFGVVKVDSRDEACEAYEHFFYEREHDAAFNKQLDYLVAEYKVIGSLTLICWCAPARCHAETIRDEILRRCK